MQRSPLRVAIVADLAEEHWLSMDLVADMLFAELTASPENAGRLDVRMLRPPLARVSHEGFGPVRTIDRFANRFWDYPRWLGARAADFDVFHIVDHSYAHLVHALPPGRAVVTCHDADAFLPLVDPSSTHSRLPRVLTRRVLSGLRKARWVTCVSRATRDDLRKYDLVASDRLTVVHNGVHPSFTPQPNPAADAAIDALVGQKSGTAVDVLHVGTSIPRKRIDVLLRILAAMRHVNPRVRLLKAGGPLTADLLAMARTLGLGSHIVQLPFLEPTHLAALYRRAAVVLQPSAREGFGLPVIEALACGSPVVATHLPVFREVGGDAATYCALNDITAWRDAALELVRRRDDTVAARRMRASALEQAGRFSWVAAAASLGRLYESVVASHQPAEPVVLAPSA